MLGRDTLEMPVRQAERVNLLPMPLELYLQSLDLGPKPHIPSNRELRAWGSLYMAERINALPFWKRCLAALIL